MAGLSVRLSACRLPAPRPPLSGSTLKFGEPLSGTPVGGETEGEEGGGRSVTLTFQPAAPHKENYQTDAGGRSNTSDISALNRTQTLFFLLQ